MAEENNGILASVPGQAIGAGSQSLPRPGPGQPAELAAVVDAGHRGWVRILYRLKSHRHGKNVTWFWNAYFAEQVEPGGLNEP